MSEDLQSSAEAAGALTKAALEELGELQHTLLRHGHHMSDATQEAIRDLTVRFERGERTRVLFEQIAEMVATCWSPGPGAPD